MPRPKKLSIDECFCGAVTLGERGQVVIPAAARSRCGMNPGDKLLVFFHPFHNGIVLTKIDTVHELMSELLTGLTRIESAVNAGGRPKRTQRSAEGSQREE